MLTGLRVLDLTTEIAGPYCTKLLADAGADVVKVEPAGGDPLRRWRSGALYEFLNAGKRSAEDAAVDAEIVVTNERRDVERLRRSQPAAVVVTITPFGCTGPWVDRPATEFTLQAAAGSTGGRGLPDQPPLAAGGRLGEFLTGSYAAVSGLAAARAARRSGVGEHVDVAMLDCMTVTMATYPSVFAEFLGWPDESGPSRSVEVPSIEPTKDGYANFTTNSRAQYEAFLLLIGRPDMLEDGDLANARHRFRRRAEFLEAVHTHTTAHTTAEVLEQAAALRVPAGEVFNGATVTGADHFVERGVYVRSPSGRFVQPRVPYRIHEPARTSDFRSRTPQHAAFVNQSREGAADWRLPLAGIRVVDCTAWWAGPAAGHLLACLGADVVKVESVSRPDLMRYSGTRTPPEDKWWEWGPIFHAVNVNKRGITLDLTNPAAVEVFHRLLTTADVLIENNTPRVMEQFGLTWEVVHARHPQLVMARLPAFGLDGPWRDRPGFAQTMEALSGMAWVTGLPDGPPVLVRGACDPLAAAHAIFGLLVALERRAQIGQGLLLEATMVEAALNVAAEQVLEYQLTGEVLTRQGGRGPGAAPQGVYRCAGNDRWLAIAVASDDHWKALQATLGDPPWAAASDLATDAGRRAGHDRIDAELEAWCADQDADELAERLGDAGVPAAVVVRSRDAAHNPQLRHRGLFEVEDHPVTGGHEIPTMPFRFSRVEAWLRFPSPTLGQHNDEVLDEIGVAADERARLRAAGLIGDRPVGV